MSGQTPIAEDFEAIADALRELQGQENPDFVMQDNCQACDGGGWEAYGLGHHDPHFRVCPECGNPRRLPSP